MLCCGLTAHAQMLRGAALVKSLQAGGHVIVMRHASSPNEIPKTPNPDNTPPQRQLDEIGRTTTTAMGEALRRLKVPIGEVMTSPTYRARETARRIGFQNPKSANELGEGSGSMQAVSKEQLDPTVVDKEREILSEAARKEGKPENIIAKMIEGRLKNFYAERVLLELPRMGYAAALEAVDAWLPELLSKLLDNDLLILTADHGNDPTTPSTDHSREHVPLLVFGPRVRAGVDLGTRATFADRGVHAVQSRFHGVRTLLVDRDAEQRSVLGEAPESSVACNGEHLVSFSAPKAGAALRLRRTAISHVGESQ